MLADINIAKASQQVIIANDIKVLYPRQLEFLEKSSSMIPMIRNIS